MTKDELRAELERQAERYKEVYGGEVTTYAAQPDPERKPWRKRASVRDQAFSQPDALVAGDIGGLVGEISYLTGKPASADVRAGTVTRLFVISHSELDRIKLERPDLHNKLMYVLGREVAQKLANANHLVTASRF